MKLELELFGFKDIHCILNLFTKSITGRKIEFIKMGSAPSSNGQINNIFGAEKIVMKTSDLYM